MKLYEGMTLAIEPMVSAGDYRVKWMGDDWAASTIDKICKVFNITPVELLLTKAESNEDTIKNITVLLAGCSPQKLKRIYEIISMMLKL